MGQGDRKLMVAFDLWWPLICKAVSGPMQGAALDVLDEEFWQQTTWGEIKSKFSDVLVLEPAQDFERPASWPKYVDNEIDSLSGQSIATKWGENSNRPLFLSDNAFLINFEGFYFSIG